MFYLIFEIFQQASLKYVVTICRTRNIEIKTTLRDFEL